MLAMRPSLAKAGLAPDCVIRVAIRQHMRGDLATSTARCSLRQYRLVRLYFSASPSPSQTAQPLAARHPSRAHSWCIAIGFDRDSECALRVLQSTFQLPSMMALILEASISIPNGLVITCMPGSSRPLPIDAFSA